MIAVPLFRSGLRDAALALLLAVTFGACEGRTVDTLASWREGEMTAAELDALVRSLPAARRQPAGGESLDQWIEARAGELALSEILQGRATVQEPTDAPEVRLRARYEAGQEIGRGYLARRCTVDDLTDEELAEAFERTYPQEPEEWILVRHIYKRSPSDASPAARAETRRALERLRGELDAGASFVELARLHSDSETAEEGGLIGRLSRQAPIEPRVRDAAWSLGDGEHGQVVEVDNGFHLLLRERSGVRQPPSLDQVRPELLRAERLRRREACGARILAELGASTPVTVDREALLDPEDETRVALRIGEETFTARQLAGLSSDLSPLMLTPRPGELLRHFSEAVLLQHAAAAEDPAVEDEFAAAQSRAHLRLLRERQWQRERLRVVEHKPAAELRDYFDRNTTRFQTDLELDVGLITVGGEGRPGRRPAMERALALRRRITSGESFEELAATTSEHGSRDEAGRLGLLPLPRLRVILGSRGATQAAALGIGEISAPTQIHDPPVASFALIKLYGRRDPQPRTFEQARAEVIATLSQENVQQLDREVRRQVLAEAGFELHADAVAAYIANLRG